MPFKQTFHQNDPLDAPEDLIPVKQAYHFFFASKANKPIKKHTAVGLIGTLKSC